MINDEGVNDNVALLLVVAALVVVVDAVVVAVAVDKP